MARDALTGFGNFILSPLLRLLDLSALRDDAHYRIQAHPSGRLAVHVARATRNMIVAACLLGLTVFVGFLTVASIVQHGLDELWGLLFLLAVGGGFTMAAFSDVKSQIAGGRKELATLEDGPKRPPLSL